MIHIILIEYVITMKMLQIHCECKKIKMQWGFVKKVENM